MDDKKSKGKMSETYDGLIPRVIDDAMLDAAVAKQAPKDAIAAQLAKEEGIEYKDVTCLQLDFRNILQIGGLWELVNLTKLQLDNNIIEKIEGIDMLVNLVWLDLSFNNIEVIEGLNTLTKLEDLTLYNNRISCIENLDNLVNLQVFSIGNNNLTELENLPYLRDFPKLKSLNLWHNPICDLEVYHLYVGAFLPDLVYLDYKMMSDEVREKGYEFFQIQVEAMLENERRLAADMEADEAEAVKLALHTRAFVPELDGEQLFHEMYKDDPDGRTLVKMPGGPEQYAQFKAKFVKVCQEAFNFGIKAYEPRMAEVHTFFDCLEQAKTANREMGMKAIEEFLSQKKQMFDELQKMTDPRIVHHAAHKYNAKVTELWDVLMGHEMTLVDQLEDTVQLFEISVQDFVAHFVESITGFISRMRDLENHNHERVLALGNDNLDSFLRGEVEGASHKLIDIFSDKDTWTSAAANSHDVHMLTIDKKEDGITSAASKWAADLIQRIHDEEGLARNRHRVIEINHFIDNLREELDDLDIPLIV